MFCASSTGIKNTLLRDCPTVSHVHLRLRIWHLRILVGHQVAGRCNSAITEEELLSISIDKNFGGFGDFIGTWSMTDIPHPKAPCMAIHNDRGVISCGLSCAIFQRITAPFRRHFHHFFDASQALTPGTPPSTETASCTWNILPQIFWEPEEVVDRSGSSP